MTTLEEIESKFEELFWGINNPWSYVDSALDIITPAITERDARIAELEAQQWTPVGEQLPFPGTDVLVTDRFNCSLAFRRNDGVWMGKPAPLMIGPTHWMPLPPPPPD